MDVVEIDGSYGSGGGQILRTSLALSILTKRSFRIKNIRARRQNPGLRAQHLACVNFAKEFANAHVENAFIGSKEILFQPKELNFDIKKINIGTAGSIGLVLQTLMLILIEKENFNVEIIGGTDVKGAPPIDYIKFVLLKLLEKINYKANIEVIRRGFYPKGGGIVNFKLFSSYLRPYSFVEKGKIQSINGKIVASKSLEKRKVVERIEKVALELLKEKFKGIPLKIDKEYVDSFSDGAVFCLWLNRENSVVGASSLGEIKKSSEDLAKEAVENLQKEARGVVDSHAADQLLPFLSYIVFKEKKGLKIKTSVITDHTQTNAFVIEKFLPVKFEINEKLATINILPT
jgi:RNA 3'-terminal phosphate cyclase (ATP)